MPDPIVIVDYDPNWPDLFEQIKAPVERALGDLVIAIEHVGSTSVPELPAKPIIDIDVVLGSRADLPNAIEFLASIGYEHQGDLDIPGREAFKAPPGSPAQHLYVVTAGNEPHRRHLALRDRLLRDQFARRDYGELKRGLAVKYRNDRDGYLNAKTAFIEGLVAEELENN